MTRALAGFVCAGLLLAPAVAAASDATPTPVDGLGTDLAAAFTGTNLLFDGGAVAVTGVMAFGGLDQDVRVDVQQHVTAPAATSASLYAGYLVPAIVAPGVYVAGLLARDREAAGAGAAALQSLGVALATMALLKVGTGREYPGAGPGPGVAHTFAPFQTLWPLPAWPSGHTIGTMSVAAALWGYFPDRLWIPVVGYALAVGIGAGLVVGEDHWASDVLAGALLGHAIGSSIGRSFRLRAHASDGAGASDGARVDLVPVLGPGVAGVGVGGAF